MQHLDHCAQPNAGLGAGTERLGGEQQQQRPNSLATPGDQILRYVRHHFNRRSGLTRKLMLDGGKVIANEIINFGSGRDGEGTHRFFRLSIRALRTKPV
jgi:hypothetical protein